MTLSVVPRERILRDPPLTAARRYRNAGLTPEDLDAAWVQAERGDMERLMSITSTMVRMDAHVRSTYSTMLSDVASAKLVFKPTENDELSAKAAAFLEDSWKAIGDREGQLQKLLHAVGVSVSVLEQIRERRIGKSGVAEWYVQSFKAARPTDTSFHPVTLSPMVRTYDERGAWSWVDTSDEPSRWMTWVPGDVGIEDHLAGLLFGATWPWMFKKWIMVWLMSALERDGAGFYVGHVPSGAPQTVRDAMLDMLENLTSSHAAAIEVDEVVEILESSKTVGEAHIATAEYFDNQITKLFLGSTLAVDSGDRGARSLGDTQAEQTIEPRTRRLARGFAGVVRDQWAKPMLWMNQHILGHVPDASIPECMVGVEEEMPPVVTAEAIQTRSATRDEVRAGIGLPPIGGSYGAEYVGPDSGVPSAGGGAPRPFSSPMSDRSKGSQLSLPIAPSTSLTSSPSPTTVAVSLPWDE